MTNSLLLKTANKCVFSWTMVNLSIAMQRLTRGDPVFKETHILDDQGHHQRSHGPHGGGRGMMPFLESTHQSSYLFAVAAAMPQPFIIQNKYLVQPLSRKCLNLWNLGHTEYLCNGSISSWTQQCVCMYVPLKKMYCTRQWRKPQDGKHIGEVGSCEWWMAERTHQWIEKWLEAAECSCSCNCSCDVIVVGVVDDVQWRVV